MIRNTKIPLLTVIVTVILQTTIARAAGCQCSKFADNISAILEVSKKAMSSNIADFCRTSTISDLGENKEIFTSWQYSRFPDEQMRLNGLQSASGLEWFGLKMQSLNGVYKPNLDQLRDMLEKGAHPTALPETPFSTIEACPKYDFQAVEDATYDKRPHKGLSVGTLTRTALCTTLDVFNALACEKNLDNVIETLVPRLCPRGLYTNVPTLKKVFTDERYIEGAKRAAMTILDKVTKKIATQGHLFDDLVAAYKSTGLGDSQAQDFAWDILGVISTQGANIGSFVLDIKADPKFDRLKMALATIATGAPVLDSRTIASGHAYSYPASVTTTCDTGKTYHFWMTAFLARKASRDSGNAKAAAEAAYLAQKGYEMRSSTLGRDPDHIFTKESFNPTNNVMRADLAFSSAGAVFGAAAGAGQAVNLSVDEGLKTIIESGTVKPPLSKDDSGKLWRDYAGAQGYLRWQKIFAPDPAFYLQLRNLK